MLGKGGSPGTVTTPRAQDRLKGRHVHAPSSCEDCGVAGLVCVAGLGHLGEGAGEGLRAESERAETPGEQGLEGRGPDGTGRAVAWEKFQEGQWLRSQ